MQAWGTIAALEQTDDGLRVKVKTIEGVEYTGSMGLTGGGTMVFVADPPKLPEVTLPGELQQAQPDVVHGDEQAIARYHERAARRQRKQDAWDDGGTDALIDLEREVSSPQPDTVASDAAPDQERPAPRRRRQTTDSSRA